MSYTPTQIEPYSPTEMTITWNSGQNFILPYIEIRFYCPCAGCVDEHTGKRTIEKTSIHPAICPTQVQPVGRYAIQISWSDGHDSGIYHFDRLFELCQKQGQKHELQQKKNTPPL